MNFCRNASEFSVSPAPQSQFPVPPPFDRDASSQQDEEASRDLAGMLENAVDATLDETSDQGDMTRRLRSVSAKYKNLELSPDIVLPALVGVITCQYSRLTEEQRTAVNTAVARTLFEDAETRMRLEKLWRRLQAGM